MFQFIESPMYDKWFIEHKPEKSFLVCSPYIKLDAISKIFELYGINDKNSIDFKLLIRGNSDEFSRNSSSDLSVLDMLIGLTGFDLDNVRRAQNLHMKAYLVDEQYLLITSGNMTNSGIFAKTGYENFEGGIATDDEKVISDFKNYFNHIWMQSEPLVVFYDDLLTDYNKYIKNRNLSDDFSVLAKVNRKKYKFKQYTKFESTSSTDLTLDYILPAGDIKYLDDTLSILKTSSDGLKTIELGKMLREKQGLSDLDNKTNNSKFGEEKGKFAIYLGFAYYSSTSPKIISITKLGKDYLESDAIVRNQFVKQQTLAKPFIIQLLRDASKDDFDLESYLVNMYPDVKESTLLRKKNAIKSLLTYISSAEPVNAELIHKICPIIK